MEGDDANRVYNMYVSLLHVEGGLGMLLIGYIHLATSQYACGGGPVYTLLLHYMHVEGGLYIYTSLLHMWRGACIHLTTSL